MTSERSLPVPGAGQIVTEEEREKLVHLLRYLNGAVAGTAAGWLLSLVLSIIYPGPFIIVLQSALLARVVLLGIARQRAKADRMQSAVNLDTFGFWMPAVGLVLGGAPFLFAAVMIAMTGFVTAAPYVSIPKLRWIGLVSVGVMAQCLAFSIMDVILSRESLPTSWVDWAEIWLAPIIALNLIASLWQTRLVLNEMEQRLEEKVEQRTAALERSRADLAVARDAAVAANRHKSAFLANMSHELRTPLNAVIGFSEVLVERVFGDLNDKQEEYLNDIHHSGRHLLALINDILDLSKIEAGRLELSVSSFDLSALIEDSFMLMKERASANGVSLTQEIASIGAVVADERKLKQVLINLLSNAVKFTKNGGTVTVKAHCDGEELEISVADTGIGIASKDHTMIFEEFRQTDDAYSRAQEGTGLGLALTKRLVELHGGRIWVESEVGRGSTFAFRIPLQAVSSE